MPELLVILLIVVVLFGSSKLPQLGAGLGQGIKSFKKALSDANEDDTKTTATKTTTTTDTGSKQA